MVGSYQDRLAEAMRDAGVNPRALAKAVGVSYQAIVKVVEGKSRSLSAKNNARAAEYLGVSSDWLASGAGPKAPARQAWPFTTTRTQFDRLPFATQQAIDQIITSLVAQAEDQAQDGPALPAKSRPAA